MIANPISASGIRSFAAATGTRLKKPIKRRSKKPVTPSSRLKPMKCSVSHSGQTHVLWLIHNDSGVACNHWTNGSRTVIDLLVGEQPAGDDRRAHSTSDSTASIRRRTGAGASNATVARRKDFAIAIVTSNASAIIASLT